MYFLTNITLFFTITFAILCSCSHKPLRIYGGKDIKFDEYPYVVRIEVQRRSIQDDKTISYEHEQLCTASALSSVWILSAAHCLEGIHDLYIGHPFDIEKLVIRHGHVEDLPSKNDSFSDVVLIVKHPLYSSGDEQVSSIFTSQHDISLLKTTPMNIKSFAKLSAVDYKCFNGHEAILAGFGLVGITQPNGSLIIESTLTLKKPLQVLIVLITKCSWSNRKHLLGGLCLASRCHRSTIACGGDSGGPLLHPSGVIGVLVLADSSGYCLHSYELETSSSAGYVMAVAPYIEWIYSNIKP